jgi:putative ABC transport system ATP-binding protein
MSAIIKLNHIKTWYNHGKSNEVYALKDINIEVEAGDYAAFFGPSGCGKTTMLYAISGIDRVSEGEILIKNKNIANLSNQELAIFRQAGIGIIFQQFNLVPSLNVLQNVALPMAFVGINEKKAEIEAAKLLERLNLTEYAHRYPAELSGGQQQRVGIARALANNPPIIIADEPLGNLDSLNAKNVLAFLKELNEKDGRTIIMVTHEAWSLQDVRTVYHMKDGEVTNIEKRTPKIEAASGKSAGESIEKLAAKEAESAALTEMTARILSNFLMRGHTSQDILRFEEVLKNRFTKKSDALKFHEQLELPYEKGGVGLWKKKAERISAYIEELIEKRSDLNAILWSLDKNPLLSIQDEVRQLRSWSTQEFVGEISPFKAETLDELISDRIRRNISPDQFLQGLHRSVKEFGAGFPLHSAQRISERLEIIIDGTNNNHLESIAS